MSETSPFSRQLILGFPTRPEFKFSNYVISEGSRFAHESAWQVASGSPPPYSALYLYGDRGMGKTHLLMAIGNHVSETQPEKKLAFLNGREFVQKTGEDDSIEFTPTLHRLLKADYFLLDNVDLISGNQAAQEKLYHIYNTSREKNNITVFAGRCGPETLAATEPYLKSRFLWGVTAKIKPIDDAAMEKIIIKLGNDSGLSVPEKTIKFLLTQIPRNFTSIKSTVEKINRESFVQKKKASIPLVKEALNRP